MAKYAKYDRSTTTASPVTAWYDTDTFNYPALPPVSTLISLTEDEWEAHFANSSGWIVTNGQLIAPGSQ